MLHSIFNSNFDPFVAIIAGCLFLLGCFILHGIREGTYINLPEIAVYPGIVLFIVGGALLLLEVAVPYIALSAEAIGRKTDEISMLGTGFALIVFVPFIIGYTLFITIKAFRGD